MPPHALLCPLCSHPAFELAHEHNLAMSGPHQRRVPRRGAAHGRVCAAVCAPRRAAPCDATAWPAPVLTLLACPAAATRERPLPATGAQTVCIRGPASYARLPACSRGVHVPVTGRCAAPVLLRLQPRQHAHAKLAVPVAALRGARWTH